MQLSKLFRLTHSSDDGLLPTEGVRPAGFVSSEPIQGCIGGPSSIFPSYSPKISEALEADKTIPMSSLGHLLDETNNLLHVGVCELLRAFRHDAETQLAVLNRMCETVFNAELAGGIPYKEFVKNLRDGFWSDNDATTFREPFIDRPPEMAQPVIVTKARHYGTRAASREAQLRIDADRILSLDAAPVVLGYSGFQILVPLLAQTPSKDIYLVVPESSGRKVAAFLRGEDPFSGEDPAIGQDLGAIRLIRLSRESYRTPYSASLCSIDDIVRKEASLVFVDDGLISGKSYDDIRTRFRSNCISPHSCPSLYYFTYRPRQEMSSLLNDQMLDHYCASKDRKIIPFGGLNDFFAYAASLNVLSPLHHSNRVGSDRKTINVYRHPFAHEY